MDTGGVKDVVEDDKRSESMGTVDSSIAVIDDETDNQSPDEEWKLVQSAEAGAMIQSFLSTLPTSTVDNSEVQAQDPLTTPKHSICSDSDVGQEPSFGAEGLPGHSKMVALLGIDQQIYPVNTELSFVVQFPKGILPVDGDVVALLAVGWQDPMKDRIQTIEVAKATSRTKDGVLQCNMKISLRGALICDSLYHVCYLGGGGLKMLGTSPPFVISGDPSHARFDLVPLLIRLEHLRCDKERLRHERSTSMDDVERLIQEKTQLYNQLSDYHVAKSLNLERSRYKEKIENFIDELLRRLNVVSHDGSEQGKMEVILEGIQDLVNRLALVTEDRFRERQTNQALQTNLEAADHEVTRVREELTQGAKTLLQLAENIRPVKLDKHAPRQVAAEQQEGQVLTSTRREQIRASSYDLMEDCTLNPLNQPISAEMQTPAKMNTAANVEQRSESVTENQPPARQEEPSADSNSMVGSLGEVETAQRTQFSGFMNTSAVDVTDATVERETANKDMSAMFGTHCPVPGRSVSNLFEGGVEDTSKLAASSQPELPLELPITTPMPDVVIEFMAVVDVRDRFFGEERMTVMDSVRLEGSKHGFHIGPCFDWTQRWARVVSNLTPEEHRSFRIVPRPSSVVTFFGPVPLVVWIIGADAPELKGKNMLLEESEAGPVNLLINGEFSVPSPLDIIQELSTFRECKAWNFVFISSDGDDTKLAQKFRQDLMTNCAKQGLLLQKTAVLAAQSLLAYEAFSFGGTNTKHPTVVLHVTDEPMKIEVKGHRIRVCVNMESFEKLKDSEMDRISSCLTTIFLQKRFYLAEDNTTEQDEETFSDVESNFSYNCPSTTSSAQPEAGAAAAPEPPCEGGAQGGADHGLRCPFCPFEATKGERQLTLHVEREHLDQECPNCSRNFPPENFQNHVQNCLRIRDLDID
ncbi:unnamed protein product [Cyprideis torosa]|uniref:Uncharacterized protein n=1 Tax=Cyprideis torosa TaxID=163714 RepID=A0A7R8WA63_9CRUS|nr:unnamed protein product [Cyprideis torosa]CAG0884993.1 unnamed protein product [Cyprideis torosa]